MKVEGKRLDWIPWEYLAWSNDVYVRMMPWAVRAYYHELLMRQAHEGWVPDDPETCALLIGAPLADFSAAWDRHIRPRFEDCGEGRMRNAKLAEVIERANARREKYAENGKKGGRPRNQRDNRADNQRDNRADSRADRQRDNLAGNPFETPIEPRERESKRESIDTAISQDTNVQEKEPNGSFRAENGSLTLNGKATDQDTHVSGERPEGVSPRQPDLPMGGTLALNGHSTKGSPRQPRQAKLPLSAQEEEKAYAILDAAWGMVESHVPDLAVSRKAWRQRNKAAALDLVALNKTPKQVCAALEVAYTHPVARERSMHMIVNLSTLAEKWPMLVGIRQGTVKPFGSATNTREMQNEDRRAIRRGVDSDVND